MNIRTTLRHWLRTIGQRFPYLRRFSGRLGLGRWLAPDNLCEQILVDGDIVIEFDLSVPIFRHIYFHHDLSLAPETILIRHLMTPADTFADVGAHIGYFTLVAAKYAGHVFAFEPSPTTYSCLQRNLQLNPKLRSRITPQAIGLSNHPGHFQLHRPLSHPGTASLRPVNVTDTAIEQVEVDTLDHVLANHSISFLKIDVEGGEYDVLLGAAQVIKRDQPVVLCELFEPYQRRFGHSCEDIVNFFDAYEYESYRVDQESAQSKIVTLKRLDLSELSTTDANNALFVPLEQTARVLERLTLTWQQ